MTVPRSTTDAQPPRRLRSAGAILAGLLAVVALSLGTDQVLHVLAVYPPWGQPMHDPGLNFLALAYRSGYAVLGGWIAARLAPHAPVRHALVLAGIGLVLGTVGAFVANFQSDLGPAWYPVALALTSPPLTWLGGILYRPRSPAVPSGA